MAITDIDRFLSFAAFNLSRQERMTQIVNSLNVSYLAGEQKAFSTLQRANKRELLYMSRLEFVQLCVGALLEQSPRDLPELP